MISQGIEIEKRNTAKICHKRDSTVCLKMERIVDSGIRSSEEREEGER